MKYKAKIAALILVLSVFVLTTVFLFACGNETDKKGGGDTTSPETVIDTVPGTTVGKTEAVTSPESTAPETTVAQTEGVTTAPVTEAPKSGTLNVGEFEVDKCYSYNIDDYRGADGSLKSYEGGAQVLNVLKTEEDVFSKYEGSTSFDDYEWVKIEIGNKKNHPGFEEYFYVSIRIPIELWRYYEVRWGNAEEMFSKIEYTEERIEIHINESPVGAEHLASVDFLIEIPKSIYRDNIVIKQADHFVQYEKTTVLTGVEEYHALSAPIDQSRNQTHVVSSRAQLDTLLTSYAELDQKNDYYPTSLSDLLMKYNDEYFEKNALIVDWFPVPNGCIRNKVDYIITNKKQLCIRNGDVTTVDETQNPNGAYMITRLFELPKEYCNSDASADFA